MTLALTHRVSIVLAGLLFAALAQGAVAVSLGRSLAGHGALGWATAAVALVWVVGVKKTRPEAVWLAVMTLAAIGFSGAAGLVESPEWKIVHAAVSQLSFGLAVAAAAMTSAEWEARQVVADGGFPTLRSLAWMTPTTVVVQVGLGAAYRHEVTGLIPHVAWAFVAALFVIMTAAFTLTQCGGNRALKRWALALIWVTSVQLVLGVTALVGRMTAVDGAAPTVWMVVSTTTHVLTGAIVLALTMGLGAQTLRHVEPARAEGLAATGHNG